MRAPVSIIIPTLNASSDLATCVASLFEGLEGGLIRELIVSDGGSDDEIATIVDDLGGRLISGKAGRGGQLHRGAMAAKGRWLLFLHADCVLEPGWSRALMAHIKHHPSKAACFRLTFNASGLAPTIVAGWANFRSRVFGLPFGDQGLLISRELYTEIGGFADIPLMEDVAIARALNGQIRLLSCHAVTDAHKYQRRGWIIGSFRNFWFLSRYFLGVDPAKLAKKY